MAKLLGSQPWTADHLYSVAPDFLCNSPDEEVF